MFVRARRQGYIQWEVGVLTALGWGTVEGVLGAVTVDHLVGAVVPLDGEGDLQHVMAGLHDLQDASGLVALLLEGDALLHLLDQLVLHNLRM